MRIVQIVSRLPPAIDGVGHYAHLLAKELRAAHDIHTVFVVCDPGWERTPIGPGPTTLDGFPIHQLKEHRAKELLRTLSQAGMPTTALLQYVGYGYQTRGCPLWLVRGLNAWKTEAPMEERGDQKPDVDFRPGPRMLTMFHELYASGPLWSSAFWTSPVQKWIARSLAHMSEHCFTNLTVNAKILKRLTAREENDFTVLPVFSNVGEPENLPKWNERQRRLIVFGSAGQRRRVYSECKADLERTCQAMGLNEIVDIGAPFRLPRLSVRICQRGILTAAEVSREMLAARAGFFAYPTAYLGKSGIFAAYAAHGLLPLTFEGNQMKNEDHLRTGEHYLYANALSECDAEKTAKSVRRWYQENGTKNQADRFACIIKGIVGDLKAARSL